MPAIFRKQYFSYSSQQPWGVVRGAEALRDEGTVLSGSKAQAAVDKPERMWKGENRLLKD